jgi:diaminopimelate epimerase
MGFLEPSLNTHLQVVSSDVAFELRKTQDGVAVRMPEGEGFGLRDVPIAFETPAAYGWVGNPQLVLEVPSVAAIDLAKLAPPLRRHPAFSGGTNVNVVEVVSPGQARIRSWERGVEGETLCCGTGSAVAAAWLAERTGVGCWTLQTASGEPVTVTLAWAAPGQWKNLWLAGPIRRLGTLELDPSLDPTLL